MSISSTCPDPWQLLDVDRDRLLDEADLLEWGEDPAPAGLAELEVSGEAHTIAVLAVEDVTVRARVLVAEQWAGVADVLRDASACPDPWVGADPTLAPDWSDPRDRTVGAVRAERRDIAVRAAALDLGVRLGISASAVRSRAAHADTLRERCPQLWAAFRAGQVPEQNATIAAQHADSLPADAPATWAAFDEDVLDAARRSPAGKFRVRARAVRERVHPESIDDRHARAVEDRTVWVTPEHDGMATLSIFGPAVDVHAAHRRADSHARHLRAQPGETRTLAQLRADTILDLLTRGETPLTGKAPARAAVAITIPVLTLLGQGDESAILDGYGPIDLDTARRLAGEASSWVRILTHPVTGTVLDVDRTTYRVPKALRRWLGVRQPVCAGPGCTRPARDCHIDHRIEWQHGGATSADNTDPLCEPDHIIKTKSLWRLHRDETTGAMWWISPTELIVDADPPPW